MNDLLNVPRFQTEAEEAQWWFDNQHLIGKAFEEAARNGTLRRTTLADRLERSRTAQVPVVLHPADATLAQELAAKRGEMHEALELQKTA